MKVKNDAKWRWQHAKGQDFILILISWPHSKPLKIVTNDTTKG